MFFDFLLKNKYIIFVPVQDTYFQCIDFKGAKKLSKESILFNYQKLSPFLNSDVAYIQKEDKILLWFFDTKYSSLCTVPEGYLQYEYFAKNKEDIIVIIENSSISIIKEGILRYQSFHEKVLPQEINLLSKNYQTEKKIEKTYKWYESNITKIRNQSLLSIVKNFTNKKDILNILKEKASLLIFPILILLIILTSVQFGINQYLQKKNNELIQKKQKTKDKAKFIFSNISNNKKNILYFESYQKKYKQNAILILDKIIQSIDTNNIKLYYIQFNNKTITLQANAKNIEKFIEKLSKTDEIDSFKLTRQVKREDSLTEIGIDITLKQNVGRARE